MRVVLLAALLGMGCSQPRVEHAAAATSPMKAAQSLPQSPAMKQLVYVPVYSSIHWGLDQRLVNLGATLSVRNVSRKQPLYVTRVEYYDSAGKKLRDYLKGAGELGPLATAEFVVEQRDVSGGPGANFLVEWLSAAAVDEPILEAVMVGQMGGAGLSFTSPGRVLKQE